jgi:hypothetical protein
MTWITNQTLKGIFICVLLCTDPVHGRTCLCVEIDDMFILVFALYFKGTTNIAEEVTLSIC